VASLEDHDELLAVSPRGRLCFTRNVEDPNIWRIRARDSEGSEPKWEKAPLISSTRLEFNGQYAPDGKRISFESNRSGNVAIWLCDRDGSNAVQLTPLGGRRSWASRWSPDGLHLSFNSGGVNIINTSGGAAHWLTRGGSSSWSQDGQWIYFQSSLSGQGQIWKMPAKGGEAVQVTHGGGLMALESVDKHYVYYTKPGLLGSATLWRTTGPGGEERQILDGLAGWASFAVMNDGIYFLRRAGAAGGSIEFLHFASGKTEKIASSDRPFGVGISVLQGAAGRVSEILFTQVDVLGSDLMTVDGFR
jgi:hypothetical protein